MSGRESWDRYRSSVFVDEESGFRLDCTPMGIPPAFPRSMTAAMNRAFDAMESVERGEIANPSEGRQVGHYWLRAPGLAPTPEIAQEISRTLDRVGDFRARVHDRRLTPPHAARFENLLVIGIGGSALGPQLVADALRSSSDPMKPFFLDNTDPDGIDRVLSEIGRDLAKTLSIVISKSGSTPETRNGMLETAAAYRSLGLELGPHAVAITQEGSKLDRTAIEQGFLDRFPMWDWIGGRTSVTSAVGLLPAALQGVDVGALLSGAATMDRWTRTREIRGNPAALLALAWHHAGNGRGERDMVILPYKDRLALWSRYLQQLVMESLGKEKDCSGRTVHQGIAVYGNKGSTDQHAYVQQLRDGLANFFVTFIEVLTDRRGGSIEVEPGATSGDFLHGLLVGTRRALAESGRPSLTITVRDVSASSLGMLIALYERAVGLYASLVGINAYDQPGVEAGKKAAAAVLDLERRVFAALRARAGRGGTAEELAAEAGAEDVEIVFGLLEHLAANPSRGVERTAGTTPFDARYRTEAS